MIQKTTLVTGIRPTGGAHLGNYYGAMKNIIRLQEAHHAFFFIADIHSLTTHPKPASLQHNVLTTAKDYLAAGLDPDRCTFYAQSAIAAEVCELQTYLGMVMPLGDLLRCPTFKEKARKHPDNVNYGLVGYPVLMAADILVHRAVTVPVGEDQLVHLEMARTIARRFNHLYGDLFPEPQPLQEQAVRIPSLTGTGKMSKSDSPDAYISLHDEADTIRAKIKKAFSDPHRIYKHEPGHPTVDGCNVYHLHTFFTDPALQTDIAIRCQQATLGCVDCKAHLAESLLSLLAPFQERRAALADDYVHDVLTTGGKKAKTSAQTLIAEVRKAIGIQMY